VSLVQGGSTWLLKVLWCGALTDIRRTGRGLPVYLKGSPLHSKEAEIPLLSENILVSNHVSNGCRSSRVVDDLYRRMK
jgi:hypothetical protein